jgi:aspartyl-tRNA(Asn)/glutamyl-tRNA(Gln) amidotransferase subunit A
MGSSTEFSAWGPTANPWDLERVPGGSSGGSASAVAAFHVPLSIGTDTGGSIRQPAALCGVVGLKPTYGLVSRYGLVAFASSLDQIGPFGHTVADAAALLNVIAGHDPMDSTSAPEEVAGPPRDCTAELDAPLEGLTLGLEREHYLSEANDPYENEAIYQAVETYKRLGARVIDVNLRHTDYGIPCYYIIATAEASSNLARYDGVHYGHRTASAKDMEDLYAATRDEGLGDEVERLLRINTEFPETTAALTSVVLAAICLKAGPAPASNGATRMLDLLQSQHVQPRHQPI